MGLLSPASSKDNVSETHEQEPALNDGQGQTEEETKQEQEKTLEGERPSGRINCDLGLRPNDLINLEQSKELDETRPLSKLADHSHLSKLKAKYKSHTKDAHGPPS